MTFFNIINTMLALLVSIYLAKIYILKLSYLVNDQKIRYLFPLFILKLSLIFILVIIAWLPGLDINSEYFGYDPQRFYFHALNLSNSRFDFSVVSEVEPLNYVGIVYYYAAIFYIIAENPFIPFIINSLVTLYATILVVKVTYILGVKNLKYGWWVGLGIFLPEVIWFDMMTSRETLSMSLITIIDMLFIIYIMKIDKKFNLIKLIILLIPLMSFLYLVRGSAVLAPILTISIISIFIKNNSQNISKKIFIIGGMIIALASFPYLAIQFGSSGVGLEGYWGMVTGTNSELVEGWQNTNGLGGFASLLIPNNIFEAILYVPIRLVLYLLSPLGVSSFSIEGIFSGNWVAWQFIIMGLSAILNLIFFPLLISGTFSSIKFKQYDRISYYITVWIVLLMISGGNFIIHDRYRVMGSLLLWGSYCLGYTSPPRIKRLFYTLWILLLFILITIFIIIKI
jgi:hypothetical protein